MGFFDFVVLSCILCLVSSKCFFDLLCIDKSRQAFAHHAPIQVACRCDHMRSCSPCLLSSFFLRLRAYHGFTRKGQVCVEKGGDSPTYPPNIPFPCDPTAAGDTPTSNPSADTCTQLRTPQPLGHWAQRGPLVLLGTPQPRALLAPWAACPTAEDTPTLHPLGAPGPLAQLLGTPQTTPTWHEPRPSWHITKGDSLNLASISAHPGHLVPLPSTQVPVVSRVQHHVS